MMNMSGLQYSTTAAIQKWGNSQGIRIPRYILEQTELDIGLEDRSSGR